MIERCLAGYVAPMLVPTGDLPPPLGTFPTLAVQVSASLLGFYLASVSIVLGTSYQDVSADVRALVLGSARVRLYLQSVGMAIGVGLILVLSQSLGIPFGYLTAGLYALLVVFSGWAFAQLAFGAFNLFNPIALAEDPLRALYRSIGRLGSKGLAGDEAVLGTAAQEADKALRILAELIRLTGNRASVDQSGLAGMVERLLARVQLYAQKKHLLGPTSAWFILEAVYPKWIEADHSSVSIALETSTPLPPQMKPAADWLERRSADLASAALEVCVAADDRDMVARITRAVASTAWTLARYSRLDDAIAFSGVVRDRCWAIESENAVAIGVAAGPPFVLANLLLGWRDAIDDWPNEVRAVVAETEWNRRNTAAVRIRGPERVWTAAQRLLQEIQAEHDIEGRRVTPDWYLSLALADAYIFSLREFAKKLPELVDDFVAPAIARSSPVVKASVGSLALQALAKAQLVADTIPKAVEGLESLRSGNAQEPAEELERLSERVQVLRSQVLERIAEAVTELRPEQSQFEPDYFGEAFFTLVHYTEQAITNGDVPLVETLFPKVLSATLELHRYIVTTYQPPTYRYNRTLFDPMVDLLELSGLAVIYGELLGDRSADPVCQAWVGYVQRSGRPEDVAKGILSVLDEVDGQFWFEGSQRDIARFEWGQRLSKRIVEAGYAEPDYFPFGGRQTSTAPPLIKMLGVSRSMPRISLHPRAIFAAQVIGPLSGDSEEVLRVRPALRDYYEKRDRHTAVDVVDKGHSDNEGED